MQEADTYSNPYYCHYKVHYGAPVRMMVVLCREHTLDAGYGH